MRYGIFSDVHSNEEALLAVLEAYQKEEIDQYICIGDIVGYGADPARCICVIEQLNSINIAGNHDWAAAGVFAPKFFNADAKAAILWTQGVLGVKERLFLKELTLVFEDQNLVCVHGTLARPGAFDYLLTPAEAKSTFALLKKDICFVGHTHAAAAFAFRASSIFEINHERFSLAQDTKYICNVGSVGQPRDGNSKAAYCIFDAEKKLVELKRIGYNIKNAQNKIRKAGLPDFLAARLDQG